MLNKKMHFTKVGAPTLESDLNVRKKGLYMSKLKATLVIVIGALAIGGTVYFKNRNDALDKISYFLDRTKRADYVKYYVDSYGLDFSLAEKIWKSYSHVYSKELLNEFGLEDTLHIVSVHEDSLDPVIKHKLDWIKTKTMRKHPYDNFLTIIMIIDMRGCKEFADMAKSIGITNDKGEIDRMWKKASLKMTEAIIDEFGAKKAIRMLSADPNDPNEKNDKDRIEMLKMFGNIASLILKERSHFSASSHQ